MIFILLVSLLAFGSAQLMERPIIGILTEEVNPQTYPQYSSLIAASYVKAVEQSGARVVPIFINQTQEYYSDILSSVNGVLFPGGGLLFTDKGGYADAGRIILDYTKQVHSAGDHFPVMGICLGFEMLFYLEVGSYDVLDNCNVTNVALSLKFKKKFQHSRLYRHASQEVIDILSSLPVTYNHHKRCVTEALLNKFNLNKEWRVLSTSADGDGKEFISSVESDRYPIAGIQFHPEKNAFEWNPSERSVHSHKAVYSARHFYDWLVDEAKRNNHSFQDSEAESAALIYNYNPIYVGNGSANYFEQIYLFE